MTNERRWKNAGAKVLLLKTGVLALAILLSGFVIGRYDVRASDDNYIAAVLEKDRLIRNTPAPKVILVGGSNLAFGVDSRMMQDSLGMPVVNMGLYAKLGLRYMLAQVRPYIERGDLVVIVPEYDQFYGTFADGDNTLNTALLYAPPDRIGDFVRAYSVVDVVLRPRVENARRSFMQAAASAAGVKEKYFPRDTNPVYNRRSFNSYGDVVTHLGKPGKAPDSIYAGPLPPHARFNERIIDDLNAIAELARERGATAAFMFPSYLDRAYAINSGAIDQLLRELRTAMKLPIAGTPADFVYPGSEFFDTRYHLNERGRVVRTSKMITVLREWLERRPSSSSRSTPPRKL
ncbi:MAG: hypothetical protein H0U59_07310 [Gemmatimonadaceae bacterium]|nr:hypothetical protein [Gemmatimonadaceae bacterium]